MRRAYSEDDDGFMEKDLKEVKRVVSDANDRGMIYGEVSVFLFPAFADLYRIYGPRARFVLIVRRAEDFVWSALSRGFFLPSHPDPQEHIYPHILSPLRAKWATMTPFEKCLWYWSEVNTTVLRMFSYLPPTISRVVKMEDLSVGKARELLDFCGICKVPENAVAKVLECPINASPRSGLDAEQVNRNCMRIKTIGRCEWTDSMNEAYERWAAPLMRELYTESFSE